MMPLYQATHNPRNPMHAKHLPLILTLAMSACVGGPTADYYTPTGRVERGTKGPGPVQFEMVDGDLAAAREAVEARGAMLIGRSTYTGKVPEAVELKKRARIAGANLVLYSVKPASYTGTVTLRTHPWANPDPQHVVHILFYGVK